MCAQYGRNLIGESLPLTDMWYINGRVESLPLTNMRYINGRVRGNCKMLYTLRAIMSGLWGSSKPVPRASGEGSA